MCLICIDFYRGRLTPREAKFNLGEMSSYISSAHAKEVEEMIEEAEKDDDESRDSQ